MVGKGRQARDLLKAREPDGGVGLGWDRRARWWDRDGGGWREDIGIRRGAR